MSETKGCDNCYFNRQTNLTICFTCMYSGKGSSDNWQPKLEVTDDTATILNKELICPHCGGKVLL